jgi:hypothetical protein
MPAAFHAAARRPPGLNRPACVYDLPMLNRFVAAVGVVVTGACVASAQVDPSWVAPFEPFKVAGNLYFVGTRGLSSFLFVTPDGAILVDTGLEATVPMMPPASRSSASR